MNEREKNILNAIIYHYIKTGESVGSRTLEKQYDFGISSATIRNIMSDLENLGFIEKLHTSSGRVPTEGGYKVYIDDVMNLIEEEEDKVDVNSYVELKTKQVGLIIDKITNLVASSTKSTVVSTEPSIEHHNLKKIELIHVNDKRCFVVAITDLGIVKTANLNFRDYTTEITLKNLTKYINDNINKNQIYTLEDLKKILFNIGYLDEGFDSKNISILHIANETSMLLHFDDLSKGIDFIENKDNLRNLVEIIKENKEFKPFEVNVLFGTDFNIKGIENMSLMFSVYEYEGERGVICILGSRRMNYKENIAILRYANDLLKQALSSTYNIKLIG